MSDLPPGWAWTTLGEVSQKPQYGWTTKADPDGHGIRLLRTTDITSGWIDWSRVPACTHEPDDPGKYLLATDDVVVSRAGSVGASIRVNSPPPAVFASYLIRLRAVGIEPAYMASFLQSQQYWSQIRDAAAGIALLNVNAKKLAAIRMPLPPLNEQRRIVAAIEEHLSRLDAADASLAAAARRVQALEEALDAQDLNGWELESLGVLCPTFVDCPHRTPTYVSKGIPALRPRDVVGGRLDLAGAARVDRHEFEIQTKRRVPRAGDVVYSRELSLGWAVVVPDETELCLSQGMVLLRPSESMLPEFLARVLNSSIGRAQAFSAATGSAHPHINLRDIRAYRIPVPPLEEQRRIVQEVEERLSRIDAMRASIERAQRRSKALRAAILERAFRGELVPQDPSDEPAEALLARIRAERESAGVRSRQGRKSG